MTCRLFGRDRPITNEAQARRARRLPSVCGGPRRRLCAACAWHRHRRLDAVTFGEDLSRLRVGHGAKNMAVVRHFALNLVRQVADKRSIKRRRKRASWDPQYLLEILGPLRR
jgi:hypothetical protein